MKKLWVLLFFGWNMTAIAQNDALPVPAYEKGAWYLNTGFSFGYYQHGFSGNRNIKILPTIVSVEAAFSDQFSLGAFLGYAKWDYLGDYDLEFISFGARISWHMLPILKQWVDLDLDQTRWDLYVSGLVGLEYRVADELQNINSPYGSSNKFIVGPVVGIKYFLIHVLVFMLRGGEELLDTEMPELDLDYRPWALGYWETKLTDMLSKIKLAVGKRQLAKKHSTRNTQYSMLK